MELLPKDGCRGHCVRVVHLWEKRLPNDGRMIRSTIVETDGPSHVGFDVRKSALRFTVREGGCIGWIIRKSAVGVVCLVECIQATEKCWKLGKMNSNEGCRHPHANEARHLFEATAACMRFVEAKFSGFVSCCRRPS
jgi:hypothetical protein